MRTFRDAKAMAISLRQALSARQIALSHGQALDMVAVQFGCANWNVLAAKIDASAVELTTSGDLSFRPPVPVLRIFSVAKAREFYLGYLGFRLDWEHRFGDDFPLYIQVSRSVLTLHLSEHHGDGSPGAAVFIPMCGIDAFQAELAAKDYPYLKPSLEDAPWGRGMDLIDPFSNQLRFCELAASAASERTTS